MRNEIIRFLESRPALVGALFFTALGLEITVLARVRVSEDNASADSLAAMHEMEHTCLGQVNAYLHGVDDLFTADASVAIIYHYADQAGIRDEFEAALKRARKQALQDEQPTPEDERRVLLVDDEPALRSNVRKALKKNGLVVFEAENGAEGLSKAEWVEPHVTVVDWQMPVINGPQFIEKLKESAHGKASRVVLLVQPEAEQPIPESAREHIDKIIERPIKGKQLLKAVQELLA